MFSEYTVKLGGCAQASERHLDPLSLIHSSWAVVWLEGLALLHMEVNCMTGDTHSHGNCTQVPIPLSGIPSARVSPVPKKGDEEGPFMGGLEEMGREKNRKKR